MEARMSDEMNANDVARSAMGEVAWPTIMVATGLITAYGATLTSFLLGHLPLWVATALIAFIVYAVYTVMHEAVHGSISGQDRSLKWLNDALGYVAGQVIGTSFMAHRKEHLAHHQNTNVEGQDPDMPLASGSGLQLVMGALRALPYQVQYYVQTHWHKASEREKRIFVAEICVAMSWRLALGFVLGPSAALFLLVVANLAGVFITLILFAWIVHKPHTETGRYRDTSTFVFPKPYDTVISCLWLFQNYHSIHHLFPRVPFYRYREVFNQIEPVMDRKGAPIYRWNGRAGDLSGNSSG